MTYIANGEFLMIGTIVSMLSVLCAAGAPQSLGQLSNGIVRVDLAATAQGAPYVAAWFWEQDGAVALRTDSPPVWDGWPDLEPGTAQVEVDAGDLVTRATIVRVADPNVTLRWVVELVRDTAMVRLHAAIENTGAVPLKVPSFPIWSGNWTVPGASRITWWKALSYEPVSRNLDGDVSLEMASRLHSSDTRLSEGVNPYWQIANAAGQLYFALEWCGGWAASLDARGDNLRFQWFLPKDETQLVLAPGETVDGPILCVTPTRGASEALCRQSWMNQRTRYAAQRYHGPEPRYVFTYNHWYTTRFDLTADFLRRQAELAPPFGFDFFIIDAGWYQAPGKWWPDPKKFVQGEFETILGQVRQEGIPTGIWTCPQFVQDGDDPRVDQPGVYEKFIDGHLLDLAGCDFSELLTDHVAKLRSRYGASWWKYDQLLFAEETRAGVMRNVIAFQDALTAVREANPDLFIENCQSGGRMVNEFTALITQSQWLRDGGGNGLEHARGNFAQALGAVQFLPPWTANRWTNNPGRMNDASPELLRYYCRSAMAGTWGLVADLAELTDDQRAVILDEIANYRRFNAIKKDNLYAIVYPHDGADFAAIACFTADGTQAAALVLRWDADGAFEARIPTPYLQGDERDVVVRFGAGELSRLVFSEAG